MCKSTLFLLSAFIILMNFAPPTRGFFQDEARGVRPAGMGEAFVSVADDANTVLYNPAGFSRISEMELVGMYSDLYTGLNALLYTGRRDRLGYNFISLALPVSKHVGYFGTSWTQLQSEFYQENSFALSYARRVWQKYQLDLGVNLKLLGWKVDSNAFTDEISRTGFTVDIGALANLFPNFQAGLGLDNLIPADMGVDETEFVPVNIRIGGAYIVHLKTAYLQSVQAQLELATRGVTYENGMFNLKLGVEGLFFQKLLAVRFGLNRDRFTSGLSIYYLLPQQPLSFQLDYAFTLPFGLKYTSGSHRAGLTARFYDFLQEKAAAAPKLTPVPTPIPQPAPEPAAEQALENKLQAMQKKIEAGELKPISFELNNSTIKPVSFATLDYLGGILEKYPTLNVRIEGHTDSQGKDDYNKYLSQARAESTRNYLITKFKIAPENLVPLGFGEERPIADNSTHEGRAKNRRVDFHVISQSKQNVPVDISKDHKQIIIQHNQTAPALDTKPAPAPDAQPTPAPDER